MDNLLRYIGHVISSTDSHAKHINPFQPNPFLFIRDRLRICLVTLDLFYKHWKNPKEADLKGGQFNIIQSVTSDAFISSMSAVECSAKVYIKTTSYSHFQKIKKDILVDKNVYLNCIMGRSSNKKINLISQNDYDDWKFLINMRNIHVHNNAIPQKDYNYVLNSRKYNLIKGNVIRNVNFIEHVFFIENIDRLFYNWLNNFNSITSTTTS